VPEDEINNFGHSSVWT